MRIPYSWLNEYLHTSKTPEELADVLTMGGLEVEEIQDWVSPDGSATDKVLLTKVTANRGDLLSMVGVARHAGALLGIPADADIAKRCAVEVAPGGFPEVKIGPVTVRIDDAEGCPRYTALLIEGIKVGPSPEWLANRLLAAGMRPISNVVDATNYVMWELGQPLHAFDFDLLAEGTIVVRKAREGEVLVTIDEQQRQLLPTDLLITDPREAVALAGVMGGAGSEMNEGTTRVLLESAHFDPSTIRKTALRLGMSTDASYRFERHVDPNLTLIALGRVAELILETAGGALAGPALDARVSEFTPQVVELRPSRCNAILGTELSALQMAEYLRAIEFEVDLPHPPAPSPLVERESTAPHPPAPSPQAERGSTAGEVQATVLSPLSTGGEGGRRGEVLRVTVPTGRPDIEREIDLIEEIAIVHGYEQVPMTIPGKLPASAVLTDRQRLERRARTILRACGLNETLSFSMLSDRDFDRIGLPADAPERNTLPLANPMLAEQDRMRTTLLPGLLAACETNVRQRVTDVALYEINPVFLPVAGGELPHEERRVAGIIMGSPWENGWDVRGGLAVADFYWLKGIVEEMLSGLNIADVVFERASHPTFAEGRCATVSVAGRTVGRLGEIAAAVQTAFDLPEKVYAFELDLDVLLAAACPLSKHAPLPRFPAARRDIALLMDDDDAHSATATAAAIRAAGGEFLRSVQPFDLYKDAERLGRGRKSVAFSLEFRATDRTLTDAEVDEMMAQIVAHAQAALGAEVRRS